MNGLGLRQSGLRWRSADLRDEAGGKSGRSRGSRFFSKCRSHRRRTDCRDGQGHHLYRVVLAGLIKQAQAFGGPTEVAEKLFTVYWIFRFSGKRTARGEMDRGWRRGEGVGIVKRVRGGEKGRARDRHSRGNFHVSGILETFGGP